MFLQIMQKFKMAAKKNDFWENSPVECADVGQKFCRDHSVSHRYRDKCVFAFKAEIQDGRQKWEKVFEEKSPIGSANILRVKNFIEFTLSHTVSRDIKDFSLSV